MKNYGVTVDEQKTPLGERKDLKISRGAFTAYPTNFSPDSVAGTSPTGRLGTDTTGMDARVLYSAADKSTARFFAPRSTFLYWIRLAHRASTIPVGNAQGQKFGHIRIFSSK